MYDSVTTEKSSLDYESELEPIFQYIENSFQVTSFSKVVLAAELATPLGPMIAITDEESLYFLDFIDHPLLLTRLEKFSSDFSAAIFLGTTTIFFKLQEELDEYFQGKRKNFSIPLRVSGTSFQKNVWRKLKKIPYGATVSYCYVSYMLDNKGAFRAVGSANKANRIAIIIPCHRVVQANGQVGGYGGGSIRKKWLLAHEAKPQGRR